MPTKKQLKVILSIALSALLITVTYVSAGTVSAGSQSQKHSNWCWAASACNMGSGTQAAVVNQVLGRSDCGNGSTFQWQHACNVTAQMSRWVQAGQAAGFSASSAGVLSFDQVKSNIDAGKSFGMGWFWTSGGGHALMGYGYEGNNVAIHDPMPNAGASWRSYDQTVRSGNHNWTQSLVRSGGGDNTSQQSNPSQQQQQDTSQQQDPSQQQQQDTSQQQDPSQQQNPFPWE